MKITRLTTYGVPPRWLFRTHNALIQEQSLGIYSTSATICLTT